MVVASSILQKRLVRMLGKMTVLACSQIILKSGSKYTFTACQLRTEFLLLSVFLSYFTFQESAFAQLEN